LPDRSLARPAASRGARLLLNPQPWIDAMSRSRAYRITETFIRNVCAYIRAGGYPHVAAETAGVPAAVIGEVKPREEAAIVVR